MNKANLEKNIIEARNEWTIDEIKMELRKVQSRKCRLEKQKERPDYDDKIVEVLKEEQWLKQLRQSLQPAKLTVTTMTQQDISKLTYDETKRAIKSIQSKKCLTQHSPDKSDFNEACKIEQLLQDHKATLQPLPAAVISKIQLQAFINKLEEMTIKKIDKQEVIKDLQQLLDLTN